MRGGGVREDAVMVAEDDRLSSRDSRHHGNMDSKIFSLGLVYNAPGTILGSVRFPRFAALSRVSRRGLEPGT
jgi:hypothetical protein